MMSGSNVRRIPGKCPGPPRFVSRREFLWHGGGGLGGIALACLLSEEGLLASERNVQSTQKRSGSEASFHNLTGGARHSPHFKPRAKRVIQLFMTGAVSAVDSFDPKSELDRLDGTPLKERNKLDLFFGQAQAGNLMKSPWTRRPRGQSGIEATDLFPRLVECVDDMAVIRSMTAKSSSHGPAMLQMSTGFVQSGYPCLGSWIVYGLGAETDNLPAFVVLPDQRGLPPSGAANWSNGFLPAAHQGTVFRSTGDAILDLKPPKHFSQDEERATLRLLQKMNREHLRQHPGDGELSARIASYELAARMQLSAPEALDFSQESSTTRSLYGLDNPVTEGFGRSCLLARRLIERGVRFVQLYGGAYSAFPRINFDSHEDILDHGKQASMVDVPTAGLLKDLKQRGLLDDTVVLWTTEFGRMPISQGKGRDHNPDGFTVWLAGGGVKRGFVYGATDEIGWKSVEKPTTIYDYHATILHLLGLDHTKLTFYHNGRAQRLTDVHGEVIHDILG